MLCLMLHTLPCMISEHWIILPPKAWPIDWCPKQIPKGRKGMREIISKVIDGYSIALMVDQRVSEGPRALFFNKPAHTTSIPAHLAL